MSWRHGEDGRVGAISIEYLDRLYSYALVLTGNPAEAEGLVEKTYVHALRVMGQPWPCGNMKGWLFTILRGAWLNQLREPRKDPQMAGTEVVDGAANCIVEPSMCSRDIYASKVEAEQVRWAFHELPSDLREIVFLREYEDFSYQEIACVLEDSVVTVMSRLARARAKLREMLSTAAARAIHLE
ncbi:RNA polymerase sigma-70 factor (ECF subfamily) [Silvibacterium bohemicum]|uniref:RNA polymerase sigma-70 factor (ECF subfamily) n=1 Tax=Silvibacterium bohemicum TaxID=1577686 RepID=A0A841K5J2_9BACT|nr:sigma-70 family RNA polymerase sigma factor [Silvibacterium bohemicum]MBB6146411.1 RNA polymerase sigma-70 factor (ECF subfamily) [Silvibacterium bohemicum]